jgi:hypothetical protein
MREARGRDSGSKIDDKGKGSSNTGLARTNGMQQSRICGGRRACENTVLRRAARSVVAHAALCTIAAMAYDEELADRIRQLIGSDPGLTEKKMFGGLAFLIRGNMAIAASSEGGAMVRVDPAQSDSLLATTKATVVEMRGQDMPGWLRVSSDDLRADEQLAPWVEIGTGYARSLPPK